MIRDWPEGVKYYLEVEKRFQTSEIARRKAVFRSVRPAAPIAHRSVIVTDDGIATGATMLVTLQLLRDKRPRDKRPRELIVAVPVCPPDCLEEVRRHCDSLVCLSSPESSFSVGQFYKDFRQVADEEVREILHQFAPESMGILAGQN
jgi:predicted phosphoribosyltransferase